MKTIKILGTGCARCKQTERIIQEMIEETGISANIEKITYIYDILSYNIKVLPALVIDEKVLLEGRVPTKEEVLAMFALENV